MTDNNLLPFSFPAISRKQVTAAFEGGRLTSDGGVMLLSMAERRLGIADRLAHCFPDRRDQMRITHTLADMIRARIEATTLGLDIRFVVTNFEHGSAEWIYDSLYCARGQAENPIKLHKSQLASDRTSCRSAIANQFRLVLHTAAYWLMLTVRDAIPRARDLANAEFATLRLRLIKIAARFIETASRVRLAFAACCPEADLFRGLPGALAPLGP